MKKLLKIALIGLIFVISPLNAMNQSKQNELEDFIFDKFSRMSEDQQQAIMEEAMRVEEYIRSLPKEEQDRIQKEMEQEILGLMESGVLDQLSNEELMAPMPQQKPLTPVEKKEEPKKEEAPKEEPLKFAQDIPLLKKQLKEISSAISNIVLKMETPGKITVDQLEKWESLKNGIQESQSYILVISNNDKLMDNLLSSDYKTLKSQLDTFYQEILKKDISIVVPEEGKIKNLDSTLEFLSNNVSQEQLLWNIRRFMQKFAPEEVKKEEAKVAQLPASSQTPSRPTSTGLTTTKPKAPSRPEDMQQRRGGRTPGGIISDSGKKSAPSRPGTRPGSKPSSSGDSKPQTSQPPKPQPPKPSEERKPADKKPESGGDKRQAPKVVSPIQKELDDLKKSLESFEKEISKSKVVEKLEGLKDAIESGISAVDQKALSDLRDGLVRLEIFIEAPSKTSDVINSKLAALPPAMQKSYRESALKLIKDKKYKFQNLGDILEKLSDDNFKQTRGGRLDASVRGAIDAQAYSKINPISKTHKDILKKLEGTYVKS